MIRHTRRRRGFIVSTVAPQEIRHQEIRPGAHKSVEQFRWRINRRGPLASGLHSNDPWIADMARARTDERMTGATTAHVYTRSERPHRSTDAAATPAPNPASSTAPAPPP